jgi:hypothetical protein
LMLMTVHLEGADSVKNIPDLNTLLQEGIQIIQDTITKIGGTVQGCPSKVSIGHGTIRFELPMEFQAARLHEFSGQSREPADHIPDK